MDFGIGRHLSVSVEMAAASVWKYADVVALKLRGSKEIGLESSSVR